MCLFLRSICVKSDDTEPLLNPFSILGRDNSFSSVVHVQPKLCNFYPHPSNYPCDLEFAYDLFCFEDMFYYGVYLTSILSKVEFTMASLRDLEVSRLNQSYLGEQYPD